MAKPEDTNTRLFRQRRSVLIIAILGLLYPLLRFVGFKMPKKPKLFEVNKELAEGDFLVHKEFILFVRGDKTWAVARKCTHLGCKLNFHEVEDYLECPCHQSRFTIEGNVTRGPAKKHLDVYEVEKRDNVPYYIIKA